VGECGTDCEMEVLITLFTRILEGHDDNRWPSPPRTNPKYDEQNGDGFTSSTRQEVAILCSTGIPSSSYRPQAMSF
jgi:hypothetical protein